ncbi:hypothetical protein Ari01nite_30820 [Paractinoplanes rishiriensis]|uniref:Uncharacterized protein n=1 Tax=Paractinoplanes rishiriensis TaxID=1050105 RepID=A0A919N0W4_9ACTN|nr:hypothetical protein Ari01nite_30820 [Actinoplanes rishiriensis]
MHLPLAPGTTVYTPPATGAVAASDDVVITAITPIGTAAATATAAAIRDRMSLPYLVVTVTNV